MIPQIVNSQSNFNTRLYLDFWLQWWACHKNCSLCPFFLSYFLPGFVASLQTIHYKQPRTSQRAHTDGGKRIVQMEKSTIKGTEYFYLFSKSLSLLLGRGGFSQDCHGTRDGTQFRKPPALGEMLAFENAGYDAIHNGCCVTECFPSI